MAQATVKPKRQVRCYLCGNRFEVSMRAMSIPCPGCHKAIKIEDIHVKTYLPVNELQTCGKITIAKKGRVKARRIQSGSGIECEGVIEGEIESDGEVRLGPKAIWKGTLLQSLALAIADGANLSGIVRVPWERKEPVRKESPKKAEKTAAKREEEPASEESQDESNSSLNVTVPARGGRPSHTRRGEDRS